MDGVFTVPGREAPARRVHGALGVTRSAFEADEVVARLARMFLAHPAWTDAARRIEADATSNVFFSHRPGEVWHLERRKGDSLLLPGPASDPDFVFRFTPDAVERLASVDGGIGAFAVELFSLITAKQPRLRVGFRIVAPFPRLVRRGYLGLLAAGGPRVLAFGASRGIRTLADLRRLVASARQGRAEPWELEGPGGPADGPLHRPPR
jgi:hypothetical protein